MNATLIAMPEYKTRIADLLNEDEILEMEFAISCDPEAHPVIPRQGEFARRVGLEPEKARAVEFE